MTLVWLVLVGEIYFLPTIIFYVKKHPFFWDYAMINLVAGWTILGWIGLFYVILEEWNEEMRQRDLEEYKRRNNIL